MTFLILDIYADRLIHDLGRYLATPHLDWLDDAFFSLAEAYISNLQTTFKDINLKNEVAQDKQSLRVFFTII